uniref:Rap guanine nucleotide exchange factor 6 n=1 Tax=Cacopsylla melanoneura TaxID=428564 RepID=A0A8D8PXE9_9HEMI
MNEYIDPHFIRALCKNPERRNLQDLQIIYYGLHGLESLAPYRDSVLRSLCKLVRYERHSANDVLYYTGELSTCWYILLSGSVFIDGSMFLPQSSFGKRTGGSARRPNECFVLEPSEMIVIDYPEHHQGRGGGGGPGGNVRIPPGMDPRVNIVFDDAFPVRPELFQKSNRSSHSSDTSSAYSGSDTMTSVHSSVEADEVDLSGLIESVVDSDEEDLGESNDSLIVKDRVRECLEKDPSERTDDDIEQLLDFTQHLKAFTNMTLAVRKALCGVMVFAVVEKAGTIVMNDEEELDSWSVVINGCVEVETADGRVQMLQVGDSFGILPTMEKLYHEGVMRTRCDDCQFVCITQTDYYRIQHQGEENTRRHEDASGRLVMVTETRGDSNAPGGRRGTVVIRGTPDRLMLQLIEENSVIDPTYVEDFLLTHRTFIGTSIEVAEQLLQWFKDSQARDRVTRVVLLWVNNHFTDFETDPAMMAFLEKFESALSNENLTGQLRLLNIACAAKARARNITLARPARDAALQFQVLGGYETGYGLFISQVDKGSKAEDVGLKRGDQILEVNGQSFQHVSHARALEILRGTTHLSITVKSNLLEFKQMLVSPDDSPNGRHRVSRLNKGGVAGEIARLQADPRARDMAIPPPPPPPPPPPVTPSKTSHSFMTLGPKKRLQKALMKMNLLPKNTITDVCDDSSLPLRHLSSEGAPTSLFPQSHSNPDLMSICYPDLRADYPEHVLKVYKSDQTCKYLLVHEETTAHEVVMLALQEFGITESSSEFSLCEVSVAEGGFIKQRRLPDQLQNLAERIGLSSRYYLKFNKSTEPLVGDELAAELVRESQVHFLQLNAVEVATQLTLQDYAIFRQIEATEYVDDLFELKSGYGVPMLSQFAELVNREMFWVVTEVCSEGNLVRRSKVIKQFIKVARQCKECRNFNSMFAIISGLGHGAVSRLRTSWDKLPTKYQRLFQDLQDLMDPSRNMSKYRQLVSAEQSQPPIIPFYPVVKKDLTFIHLGNDSKVEGLINFEKLRMIAKEVRTLTNMCSAPYDLLTMLELGGQPASNAMVTLNQLTTGGTAGQINAATVKRRKKSTGAPNPKKMFEEAQMVRRVKAYLAKMKVITDEDKLHMLSNECEAASVAPGSGNLRKRHPSPTLSTASTASSASEGRKPAAPKFGSASPTGVRKLLALSEPGKTRLHQPRHQTSPSPGALRRPPPPTRLPPSHERCHSDQGGLGVTPLLSSVDLNAESSSVTSLSNLPLRKTVTSGSVTSTDSGHSTQLDSHSNSSGEVPTGTSPPLTHRRHSMQPPGMAPPPPRSRPPPSYSVAAQMAARINLHRLGRAHSHEGVTSSSPGPAPSVGGTYCARHAAQGDEDDEDDETQVSAV